MFQRLPLQTQHLQGQRNSVAAGKLVAFPETEFVPRPWNLGKAPNAGLVGGWPTPQHLIQLKTQGSWVLFSGKLSSFTNLKLVGGFNLPPEKYEFVRLDHHPNSGGK